ncbi:cupin domain-containing protein, partial [Enterococcus faecium]|uniref:cupin domain-containing protein n=1 Tax=Enterococcus faecium TaxID=1352 RepID=UPI0021B1418A
CGESRTYGVERGKIWRLYQRITYRYQAGQKLSYHYHNSRDEVWTVVAGQGKAIVDGMKQILRAGDVVTIAAGCKHTIEAVTNLDIIEVQIGETISVADKYKSSLN